MKETIQTPLTVGSKVRILKRMESGSLNEIGRGLIKDIFYDNNHAPIFAATDIFDEDKRKFTGVIENLAINAPNFRLVNW